MKYIQYLCLSILIFILACTTAKEAYQKGNYKAAIEKSLKEIKDGKDVGQNKNLLNQSFDRKYDELTSRYENRNRVAIEKRQTLYREMEELVDLFVEAHLYLDSDNKEKQVTFDKQALQLRAEMATYYYDLGIEFLASTKKNGDKKIARKSYEAFHKVYEDYDTGNFPDLDSLVDLTLNMSILEYNFDIDLGFNFSQSWEIKQVFGRLPSSSPTFKKFYVDGSCKKCDCLIELNFRDLDERRLTSLESRQFEKKVQDGFTTTKDDKGNTIQVPKYKLLKGRVDIDKTRFEFLWQVRSDVDKETINCDETGYTFEATKWVEVFDYHLSGDAEAIPSEYRQYNKPNINKDDILEDLLDDLFRQVVNYYD
ncbi:MAG: hypothetical protein IPN29_08565 [Saprospiraceae bacterium]|nr:hypothetical protein [Saprospiraceae bacterium]